MIRPSESKIKKRFWYTSRIKMIFYFCFNSGESKIANQNESIRSEACKSGCDPKSLMVLILRQISEKDFLFLTHNEEHAIFLGSGENLLLCAPLPDFLQTFASENSVTPLAPDEALSKSRIILKYKIKTWTKNLVSIIFFGIILTTPLFCRADSSIDR